MSRKYQGRGQRLPPSPERPIFSRQRSNPSPQRIRGGGDSRQESTLPKAPSSPLKSPTVPQSRSPSPAQPPASPREAEKSPREKPPSVTFRSPSPGSERSNPIDVLPQELESHEAPTARSEGLLVRAQSDLLELEEHAHQDEDEARREEQFLGLLEEEPTEVQQLEALPPAQGPRVVSRRVHETEGETEFWTETEESEDEVLGLRDTGENEFFKASVVEGRREVMMETVQRDIEDVRENLQYLNVKTTIRINELRQVINKQEKRMNSLKTALKKATMKEMNQILAAGWSRKGSKDWGSK